MDFCIIVDKNSSGLSYLLFLCYFLLFLFFLIFLSYFQLAVTLFLALVVGAIFFGVKDDQSGMQNRLLKQWNYLCFFMTS